METETVQSGTHPGSKTSHPADIYLQNISFAYDGAPLLDIPEFAIKGGCWTCLLGTSGTGKSTLLRLISGSFEGRFSGQIRWEARRHLSGSVAWMAQNDLLLPWLTVLDNVCLGARLRGEVTPDIKEKAHRILSQAGMGESAGMRPGTLSGGMRQRVALLRTLMENRPVILMDEPFSALDALTRLKLQDLAARMLKGVTVVLVTHDPLEALRLGHRVHVMAGHPARIGEALIPPGEPPRDPGNPGITELQAELLRRLSQ